MFHRTVFPDQGFTPLFRLLDDFDVYSRQSDRASGNTAQRGAIFQPKFDVRELEDTFELHGELPGIDKKDVNIEFTDPQTLVVRGRVERKYTSGNVPALEDDKESTNRKLLHPTVEDVPEDGEETSSTTSQEQQQQAADAKKQRPKHKFWAYERSIGEFSRTFTFPGRIDQDAVSASLKDGILTVVVPKAVQKELRRISIN